MIVNNQFPKFEPSAGGRVLQQQQQPPPSSSQLGPNEHGSNYHSPPSNVDINASSHLYVSPPMTGINGHPGGGHLTKRSPPTSVILTAPHISSSVLASSSPSGPASRQPATSNPADGANTHLHFMTTTPFRGADPSLMSSLFRSDDSTTGEDLGGGGLFLEELQPDGEGGMEMDTVGRGDGWSHELGARMKHEGVMVWGQ